MSWRKSTEKGFYGTEFDRKYDDRTWRFRVFYTDKRVKCALRAMQPSLCTDAFMIKMYDGTKNALYCQRVRQGCIRTQRPIQWVFPIHRYGHYLAILRQHYRRKNVGIMIRAAARSKAASARDITNQTSTVPSSLLSTTDTGTSINTSMVNAKSTSSAQSPTFTAKEEAAMDADFELLPDHLVHLFKTYTRLPLTDAELKALNIRLAKHIGFAWNLMHDYQKEAVRFIVIRGGGLIADDMGLGKCLEFIACLGVLAPGAVGSVLIVAPSCMRLTWVEELIKWMCRPIRFQSNTKGSNKLHIHFDGGLKAMKECGMFGVKVEAATTVAAATDSKCKDGGDIVLDSCILLRPVVAPAINLPTPIPSTLSVPSVPPPVVAKPTTTTTRKVKRKRGSESTLNVASTANGTNTSGVHTVSTKRKVKRRKRKASSSPSPPPAPPLTRFTVHARDSTCSSGWGPALQIVSTTTYVFKGVHFRCVAGTWEVEDPTKTIKPSQIHIVTSEKETFDRKNMIYVSSYAMTRRPEQVKRLKKKKWRLVVADESHKMKNFKSQQSKAMTHIMLKNAEHRIMLTGTPMNKPIDIFPQLRALDPKLFPKRFPAAYSAPSVFGSEKAWYPSADFYFAARYCCPTTKRVTYQKIEQRLDGATNMLELNAVLRVSVMIRRTKGEVGIKLPEKIRRKVIIEMKPTVLKKIKKKLAGIDVIREMRGSRAADPKFMETIRECNALKIPFVSAYIASKLKDIAEADAMRAEGQKPKKTIIFAHSHLMHNALEKVLMAFTKKTGIGYVRVDGKTATKAREARIHRFKTDPTCRIALFAIQAFGIGITLTVADRAIMVEYMFDPSVHMQAEDRIHRQSQKNICVIDYLHAKETLDDMMWRLITNKSENMSMGIDGAHSKLNRSMNKVDFENEVLGPNKVMDLEGGVDGGNGPPGGPQITQARCGPPGGPQITQVR